MKTFRFLFLFTFLSCFFVLNAQEKHPEVRIFTGKEGLSRIAALGVPVEEGFFNKTSFHTVITSDLLEKVIKAGFEVEVIHEDYPAYISQRNKDASEDIRTINQHKSDRSVTTGNYPVPENWELGSMGGYYTLQEVMNELDSMKLHYPTLITQKAPCTPVLTHEGRQLFYVRITNLANTQAKPKVLYDALTHAREPMGMQQLIFFMWYLLENYSTNAEVQYLVDNLDLYFIPVVNPDGYEYNRTTAPNGGGDWRKNRRDNGGGIYGVDLNRNFGYKWGYDDVGSSPYPGDLTYRGPSAFSEPETQCVRDFSVASNFRLAMNYHTYSNLFLYPWCYTTQFTPDSITDVHFSNIATRENRYLPGTPGDVLYNTNGDINDWLYGDQILKPKVQSYTAEIGGDMDGFWPPVARIIPLAQENMYQNLMIAHLAFKYAEAKDAGPAIVGSKNAYLQYDFERYGMEPYGTYTVSIEPLDPNQVIMTGDPKVYINPQQFEQYHDSIAYTLSPELTVGTEYGFILKCDNGLYTYTDTIHKWYGQETIVFSDSCNNFANWFGPPWNLITSVYHTPPGSITDSPTGPYQNNANASVTTKEKIDLRDSPVAVITYWARWELEDTYDYVQIKVSDSNGSNFLPQKGRYTRNGSGNEDPGKPVYDGFNTSWVEEQVVLTDYVNNDIKIRFSLKSDIGTREDGFFFDDVKVHIIDMTLTGVKEKNETNFISDPVPNPASSSAVIRYERSSDAPCIFNVTDVRGVVLYEITVTGKQGRITIPAGNFNPGIYLCRLQTPDGSSAVKKLIISR